MSAKRAERQSLLFSLPAFLFWGTEREATILNKQYALRSLVEVDLAVG